jgi:hypothetical protein
MNTTKCLACDGHGTYLNSFNQVRRCGACKGTRVTSQAVADRFRAMRTYHLASVACSDRSLAGDASLGLGLLRDREPERERKLVASINSGRVTDSIRALAAYYREAYPA